MGLYAVLMGSGVVRSALVKTFGRYAIFVPDVFDHSLAQTYTPILAQIIAHILALLFERGSDDGAG